jgi:hypothetical protein
MILEKGAFVLGRIKDFQQIEVIDPPKNITLNRPPVHYVKVHYQSVEYGDHGGFRRVIQTHKPTFFYGILDIRDTSRFYITKCANADNSDVELVNPKYA